MACGSRKAGSLLLLCLLLVLVKLLGLLLQLPLALGRQLHVWVPLALVPQLPICLLLAGDVHHALSLPKGTAVDLFYDVLSCWHSMFLR